MKNVLSILGTGVYLPPARAVREVVLEAGQDPSAYQGWANCCHALAEDHPSTMGTTALRRALEDAKVEPAELKLVLFAGMSRDYLPSWSVATEIMKACGTGGHCMGLDMTAGSITRRLKIWGYGGTAMALQRPSSVTIHLMTQKPFFAVPSLSARAISMAQCSLSIGERGIRSHRLA